MSKLKVINGGLSVKIQCQSCGKTVPQSDAYTNAFIWATLSEDKNVDQPYSGFRTATFNICRSCGQDMLLSIQKYIRDKVK